MSAKAALAAPLWLTHCPLLHAQHQLKPMEERKARLVAAVQAAEVAALPAGADFHVSKRIRCARPLLPVSMIQQHDFSLTYRNALPHPRCINVNVLHAAAAQRHRHAYRCSHRTSFKVVSQHACDYKLAAWSYV